MSRKAKSNGSTALAMVATAPSALQITRSDANARIKARALELYHEARTQRDERIRAFEAEYGRADRIDNSVLTDLQRIQARLAAIAARQQRANATGGEPKVARFVDQIGMITGPSAPISRPSAPSNCSRPCSKLITSVGTAAVSGRRVRTTDCSPGTRSSTIARSAERRPDGGRRRRCVLAHRDRAVRGRADARRVCRLRRGLRAARCVGERR